MSTTVYPEIEDDILNGPWDGDDEVGMAERSWEHAS